MILNKIPPVVTFGGVKRKIYKKGGFFTFSLSCGGEPGGKIFCPKMCLGLSKKGLKKLKGLRV